MLRNTARETCPKFIRPRGLASCSVSRLDGEERFLEKGGKKIRREASRYFFFFFPASFREQPRAGTPPEFSRRIRTGLLTAPMRLGPLRFRNLLHWRTCRNYSGNIPEPPLLHISFSELCLREVSLRNDRRRASSRRRPPGRKMLLSVTSPFPATLGRFGETPLRWRGRGGEGAGV